VKRKSKLKAFSFSITRGADGRWRASNTRLRFLTRSQAWMAGMAAVRREMDRLQTRSLGLA
jgi:hypothetical protein